MSAVPQMTCPKCKTSMPDTATACPSCQHRVVKVSAPKEPYKTPEERAKEWSPKWADGTPPTWNKGLIGGTIAAGVLVVVIAICVSSGSQKVERYDEAARTDALNAISRNAMNRAAANQSSNRPTELSGDEVKAKYLDYEYYYNKDGEKTVAIFVPKFLPRDDKIVLGAIEDVVKRSYKDVGLTNARIVRAEDGVTNLLRMDSKSSAYLTLFIKEDTGEAHSLVVTRTSVATK